MKNLFYVTVYRTTTDGMEEYCDEYTGIRYDNYEDAKKEYYEAKKYFPCGACISNEIMED